MIRRYLHGHPFSWGLALIILATGLTFGTFTGTIWRGVAQHGLAVSATNLADGRWWTPLTALLVPGRPVTAILAIVLVLTVGAYVERKIGSYRAMLAFVATGVAGNVMGAVVQALAFWLREDWGVLTQPSASLDPSVGVVGMIMMGSAVVPALFKRRIRLLGIAALVMFALYAGDTSSVNRLFAGLIGLGVGAWLARGRRQGAWLRSSYRERRTLIAWIVAVSGLGPLMVLVFGHRSGPLGLVIASVRPVDANPILCTSDPRVSCWQHVPDALATSPGPFLVSLVPTLLILLAAWGLDLGRRFAWWLAVITSLCTAVLSWVSLGASQLVSMSRHQATNPEDAFWTALATLIPLGVVVLLVVTRRNFTVRVRPGATAKFWTVVSVVFILLAAGYVLIGFTELNAYRDLPRSRDLVADVVHVFLPYGFFANGGFFAHGGRLPFPVRGMALFAREWFGLVFWLALMAAAARTIISTTVRQYAQDRERFRALLKAGGGDTLSFMGTWASNEYWFSDDGQSAVAFRVVNSVALTTSGPVGVADEDAVRGFISHCEHHGWTPVFYSVHEDLVPIFESFGWQLAPVGEETLVDLPGLQMSGKSWQSVRTALNKGRKAGVEPVWTSWAELSPARQGQIEAISEDWVAEKALPEMGFTLGGLAELKDPDVRLCVAVHTGPGQLNPGQPEPEQKESDHPGPDHPSPASSGSSLSVSSALSVGRIESVTSWLPTWGEDGTVECWTLDFMRRADESLPGSMEFNIASAAQLMQAQGVQSLSLSGAPLATRPDEAPDESVLGRLLGWVREGLEPAYGFTSLFQFKTKFNPRYRKLYMAYSDPLQLQTIGLAIGRAYLPNATPKEYLALARSLGKR